MILKTSYPEKKKNKPLIFGKILEGYRTENFSESTYVWKLMSPNVMAICLKRFWFSLYVEKKKSSVD